MGCGIVVNQVWAGACAEGIAYRPGSIDKQELIKNGNGAATLFAFDAGQHIGESAAPFDAMLMVVDGRAEVTVDDQVHPLSTGDMILIPAHRSHAVRAPERFKMILVTLRS